MTTVGLEFLGVQSRILPVMKSLLNFTCICKAYFSMLTAGAVGVLLDSRVATVNV